MKIVNPVDLAPLIPTPPNHIIFQYASTLDGSYQESSNPPEGALRINLNDINENTPYQAAIPVFKNNGKRWTIGFNIFQEGIVIYYQSFFMSGGAPAKTRLKSDSKYKAASPAVKIVDGQIEIVRAQVPSYKWLTCSVRPINQQFNLEVLNGVITEHPAQLSPQIAKTTEFTNNTNSPIPYTPDLTYTYVQEMETSVTDGHSFEAGVELGWKGKVGWLVAESEFSVNLKFTYGYSHSTTTTDRDSKAYHISETLEINVQPGETIFVSIIIYADNDATANVKLDMKLNGSINGQVCNGVYLSQLAQAMSATDIIETSPNAIQYRLEGPINANIVSKSEIVVSNTADPNVILEMVKPETLEH